MCIQPLVENAIKHGTSQVEGQGRISIRAALNGAGLLVEVQDNGPGFPPAAPAREATPDPHALGNVSGRLSRYYGSSASLVCTNDGGARVSLLIPHAHPDRR
jgi:two-component system LytT family sensor kinase